MGSRQETRAKNRASRASARAAVTCSGDHVTFGREVMPPDAVRFRRLMVQGRDAGHNGFTLDFEQSEFASPLAMAQLVVEAESLRNEGMHFDVIVPRDSTTRKVFEHSNWAHHLSPVNHDLNLKRPRHWLPVRRYTDDKELFELVNTTLEVVVSTAKVRRAALRGLDWAMNEMADNVLVHAEAPAGGLLAVTRATKRRRVQFVVADAGRGIPSTMRTGHPHLRSDLSALQHAMQQGITRSRKIGAGNGLAGAMRIATASGGKFSVRSGRATVSSQPQGKAPHAFQRPEDQCLHGTVVYFEIPIDRQFDLEAALLQDGIGVSDWDFFDATYAIEERDVRLLVQEEAASTGTRLAGQPVRVKARNLLDAHDSSRIVIDFSGIDSMSSSFADEIVGKLLVSVGPTTFKDRVAIDGLDEPLIRGLVRRSLSQREAEALRREQRAVRRAARRARVEAPRAPTSAQASSRDPRRRQGGKAKHSPKRSKA